ncbi:unnamed protein product [Closterium sp. Naga37s-1]|nr:unnamed protein product [Closterium sp. Naga37s-1]
MSGAGRFDGSDALKASRPEPPIPTPQQRAGTLATASTRCLALAAPNPTNTSLLPFLLISYFQGSAAAQQEEGMPSRAEDDGGGDAEPSSPTATDAAVAGHGKGLCPQCGGRIGAGSAAASHDPVDLQEVRMMRERFAKLLLGEDMSGGSKGVCPALAMSNAITNLSVSLFGEGLRLRPLSADCKRRWRMEMGTMLSVCQHIVELVPHTQTMPDGSTQEVMVTKQRDDMKQQLPALKKLDDMLLEMLDQCTSTEYTYPNEKPPTPHRAKPDPSPNGAVERRRNSRHADGCACAECSGEDAGEGGGKDRDHHRTRSESFGHSSKAKSSAARRQASFGGTSSAGGDGAGGSASKSTSGGGGVMKESKTGRWWRPVPRVAACGLSEELRRNLEHAMEKSNQVVKLAMAINTQALEDMAVPAAYTDNLPKSGRAALGDQLYALIVGTAFSVERVVDTVDLTDEHAALKLACRLEAACFHWRRATHTSRAPQLTHSFSAHYSTGPSARDISKFEEYASRAEACLRSIKDRCPALPQTTLDTSKILYNSDVGKAVLESYSRVLEGVATSVRSRINDVLHAHHLACDPSADSPAASPAHSATPGSAAAAQGVGKAGMGMGPVGGCERLLDFNLQLSELAAPDYDEAASEMGTPVGTPTSGAAGNPLEFRQHSLPLRFGLEARMQMEARAAMDAAAAAAAAAGAAAGAAGGGGRGDGGGGRAGTRSASHLGGGHAAHPTGAGSGGAGGGAGDGGGSGSPSNGPGMVPLIRSNTSPTQRPSGGYDMSGMTAAAAAAHAQQYMYGMRGPSPMNPYASQPAAGGRPGASSANAAAMGQGGPAVAAQAAALQAQAQAAAAAAAAASSRLHRSNSWKGFLPRRTAAPPAAAAALQAPVQGAGAAAGGGAGGLAYSAGGFSSGSFSSQPPVVGGGMGTYGGYGMGYGGGDVVGRAGYVGVQGQAGTYGPGGGGSGSSSSSGGGGAGGGSGPLPPHVPKGGSRRQSAAECVDS